MESPGFQKGLTEFFAGAKRGMEGLQVAWEPFKDLIASLMPIISKFVGDAGEKMGVFFKTLFEALNQPGVLENFGKMLDGFLKVIENLTPAIQPFVEKLSEMMAFAGLLADVVSDVLGVAIKELAPAFGDVLEKMGPLTTAIGEFIKGGLESINWEAIAAGIGSLVEGATAFVEALNSPVIKFVRDMILDFLVTAVAGFFNLLGAVMQIVGGLLKLLSGDWSGLEDIWEGIQNGLEGLWQLFLTLFAPAKILKVLGPLGKMLLDAIGPALKGLGDLVGPALKGLGEALMKGIKDIPFIGPFIDDIVKNVTEWGPKLGQFLIEGFINGAKAFIGGFLTNVWEPIVQAVKDFFGIASPSTLFMQFGQWIIEGLIMGMQMLINGIAALFTPVIEAIRLGWQMLVDGIILLWNGFVVIITGVWNIIVTVATTVWNTILMVVTTVWNAILAVATMVWNAIVAGFNFLLSVGTMVWNAILAVAQVVWNAILAVFNVVSSAIQAGFQVIQSVAEAVWNAISAVVSAVVATIQSVIQGLSSFIQGIFNGFIAFAQSAWDGILAGAQGLVSGIQGVLGGISGIVSGIFNGIKGTIEGIWNSIQLPNPLAGLGIPGFASGVSNFGGGVAMVGERGPELVVLPKGSDVLTNGKTKSIMNNSREITPTVQPDSGTSGFTFAPTIYNPEQETTEESLFKSAQKLSYLGLMG